jgi:Protein of unknown function (DUF3147)
MSEEATFTQRVAERPALELDKVRQVSARELGIRFIAGAATSIVAGVVTLAFGARTGGIFLAFPAILAASLTLIEKEEDAEEAREDARGAVIGGVGLAAFAGVAALTLNHLAGALALLLATATWFAAALVGYFLAWFR